MPKEKEGTKVRKYERMTEGVTKNGGGWCVWKKESQEEGSGIS